MQSSGEPIHTVTYLSIPDHTPRTVCDATWHAGLAYAPGYMRKR